MTPLMVAFANAVPVRAANAMPARPSDAGTAFTRFVGEDAPGVSTVAEVSQAGPDEDDDEDASEQAESGEMLTVRAQPDEPEPVIAKPKGDAFGEIPAADDAADAVLADRQADGTTRNSGPTPSDTRMSTVPGAMLPGMIKAEGGTALMPATMGQGRLLGLPADGREASIEAAEIGNSRLPARTASGQVVPASGLQRAIAARDEPVQAPRPEPELLLFKEYGDLKAEISLSAVANPRIDAGAMNPSADLATARLQPHVAHEALKQIVSGVANRDSDQIEITLKPEELGTVRLVITGGERSSVAVYAEHPETLDLLRRHADILARELRDSGLAGAELTFADNSGTGGRHASDAARTKTTNDTELTAPVTEPASAPKAGLQSRIGSQIDIRI